MLRSEKFVYLLSRPREYFEDEKILVYSIVLLGGGLVSKRLNLGLAVKVSNNFPPQPVPLFTLK